jgi:hypothetical protein
MDEQTNRMLNPERPTESLAQKAARLWRSGAVTAGARVSLTIETTVESVGSNEIRLSGGTRIEFDDFARLNLTVVESGWQPGDVVDDGSGPMVRLVREDGVHYWQRLHGGRVVYDDETSLSELRAVSRTGQGQTQPIEGDQVT